MADLVDIGNGIKVANPDAFTPTVEKRDAIGDYSKLLSIQNSQSEMQAREQKMQLDAQNAPYERAKNMAEGAIKYADVMKQIHLSVVQGDVGSANSMYYMIHPEAEGKIAFLQPDDPIAKHKGLVNMIDMENETVSTFDPYADKKILGDIEVRVANTKTAFQEGLQRRQNLEGKVLEMTNDLNKQGYSYQEARQMAAAAVNASKDPSLNRILGSGSSQEIKDSAVKTHLKTRDVVDAAVEQSSMLDRIDLRPKKDLETKDRDGITAMLAGVNTINGRVLPIMQEMVAEKGWATEPGYTGKKISDLRSRFGKSDPKWATLSNLINTEKWNVVLEYAATTFTDKVADQLKDLIPNEQDTIESAYAKASAFTSLLISKNDERLDNLEQSGFRVDGIRALTDPDSSSIYTQAMKNGQVLRKTPEDRADQIARQLMNSYPKDIINNQRLMGDSIWNLDPVLRQSMMKEYEKRTGIVLNRGATELVKEKFKLGKWAK